MITYRPLRAQRWLSLSAAVLCAPALAAPVINELMYHPSSSIGNPEDVTAEWLEIRNPDALNPLDVSGYQLSRGVTFTIPSPTLIPANGYLVIAANVAKFNALHPGFTGLLRGGWLGTLSNGGDHVQLDDTLGVKASDVSYANEGDWAVRVRGPLSLGHNGWIWETAADGAGKTMELRNPALGAGSGQNWAVSAAAGGSPGAANSAASVNIAPLIKDAHHKPEIPRSTEAIRFSCVIEDEAAGATATLHWRLDGAATYNTVAMADSDGDGRVDATIPAQANLAVIEWYVSATDGPNTRTWPAPARTSDIGVLPQTFGQVTNAQLQVDNSFDPLHNFTLAGNQPVLRMILTNAERAELTTLQTTSGQEQSEAAFNATFISHDGTGTKVVYNSSVRNRGLSSALGPPNNYNISFRSDDSWNGRNGIQVNCQYGYGQALANTLWARAGIAPQETIIVQVRVNGADLAEATGRMFGRYAMLEGRGGAWAKHHYPNDPAGNFYRLDDHQPNPDTGVIGSDRGSGEFQYEGLTAAAWSDTFVKETNQENNDYTDLGNLTKVLSAPATGGGAVQPAISEAAYPAAVAGVLDVEEFYRFFAVDALIGNQEGGLQSGRADDVSLYRGVLDPRFRFIPHDMDDVFDIGAGVGDPITRSIFSYDLEVQQGNTGVVGLRRMFNDPGMVPKYYAALLDAMNTWFTRATVDPIIDRMFSGWVPAGTGAASPARTVAAIKAYVDARRANVLAQIPQTYALTTTGTTADSPEGYKVTTTGAATFAGTFNVAQTYSITVNGAAAQAFYRAAGADAAGTWRLVLAAGGGTVLSPGLNNVVVRFWSGVNGTGTVLQEFVSKVVWTGSAPDTLTLLAPQTYVPGVPVLVRVDLKTAGGLLQRSAWNTTVNLTATNGVSLNPGTLTLFNGMGSALITLGSSTGGASVTYFSYGTGGTGTTTVSGVGGSVWKTKTDFTNATLPAFITSSGATWMTPAFNDATWVTRTTQTGFGDGDENQTWAVVDYDSGTAGVQVGPVSLYRNTFTIADINALVSVTGEIKYDDAYAVYVNGTEISRSTVNLAAGAALTAYASASSVDNMTAALTIPLANLHTGVNTIAVELHQSANTTTDATFDFRLQGNLPSTTSDPGNFSLTATAGSFSAQKAITSAGAAPVMTNVSGPLPAGTTTWSGIMNVTGDVTVPAGATLNIQPGTIVLMAGTAYVQGTAAVDTSGADLIVNGTLSAAGTLASPISICCSSAANRWGEINFGTATPSTLQYCLLSRSGHSPFRGSHVSGSGGAMLMLNGTTLTLDDCVLADGVGKTLANAGNANLTIRRTNIARFTMGPEIGGTTLLLEDSNINSMLAANRERGAQDDEDCLYIHDSGGRPVTLSRSVLAQCDDDALDLLAGNLTVTDCILRNAFDKGASMLQNNITMRRCLLVDNDVGVSSKCQTGADEAAAYLTVMENCTIVCENHPTNTGDQSPLPAPQFHSVGVHTRNKYGTTTMNITQQLKNCIISAEEPVRNDYPTVGSTAYPLMTATYCAYQDLGGANASDPTIAGTGNITANPLFVSAAGKDFHLAAGSPCINSGDPAAVWNDPDGSRNDMGALPSGSATASSGTVVSADITAPGETHWTLGGSPYHVTTSITVAAGSTLRIDPGVNVQSDQNVRLTVNGRILAAGTAARRIVFSHVPGTNLATDVDPIKLLTQTGAPKWGGVRVYDSLAAENTFRFCDFINAQGVSVAAPENYGSVGFIRSWGWVDHCTWAGTHLRMCYGRNSKMTVTYCTFPDMFNFDPALNRIEEPTTDFIAAADNNMEPLKVEYPTTDPEVSGANAVNYPNGLPRNGLWRVYFNEFHGNRGHQDVFDCDSGRWAARDASGNQANGEFVIDCRYNHFNGLAGDEHIDLGGDAYIADNILENGRKDFWTNDTGYSNAISSGDKGDGTTIMVVRNTCYDLDHVINCKARTATIFEHNTVANMHADFQFNGQTVTQQVVCAPVNFFIPQDGANPTYGDGAYMGFNVISNVNHMFSGPDTRKINGTTLVNDITQKIEFNHNLLDQIADPVIGPNHPGGYFSGTYGPNETGVPGFVNAATEDYSLRHDSLARATTPSGFDYGASIPEWSYVIGGPGGTVAQTAASFTVGGPGIVAYKWRLDGGAWSASIQIGDGGVLPRNTPTIRQSALNLSALTAGTHTLEVLGQDMAGNWQDADPARLYDGQPQAAPTARTWSVDTTLPLVRIHEVAGNPLQQVELISHSATTLDLNGWSVSDDLLTPGEQALSGSLASGALFTVQLTNFQLDNDGDSLFLFDATNTLRDSITFGPLPAGYSLARIGTPATWQLANPSIGNAANTAARMSDSSQIVINEWLAAGGILYKQDWVELANPAAFPASLTGMVLTDSRFGTFVPFPPLSFIGGNGYVKFIADGNTLAGANHTAFKMDSLTEELLLFSATGAAQDNVRVFPQVQGVSQGRVPAGGLGGTAFFTLATAGAANGTSDPGYLNAVNILNSLRITEIMYNPPGGNNFEFIELTNIGATTLDLSGVIFYDGLDFTFPPGSTLTAGSEVLLVKNLASFQSRYGTGLNVAGQYLGFLDNNGEQLALRLPKPWDANVLCFRYESTWHNTNASGYSLTLLSNATSIEDFDQRASWSAGTQLYGSPDSWIPPPDPHGAGLNAWLTAHALTNAELLLDTDFDGLNNTLEYALNSDPRSAAAPNGADRLPTVGTSNGYTTITLDLPTTALAGAHGCPGTTYTVEAGTNFTSWTTLAKKTPFTATWTDTAGGALAPGTVIITAGPGGLTRITVKDSALISAAARRYLRLSVTVTP